MLFKRSGPPPTVLLPAARWRRRRFGSIRAASQSLSKRMTAGPLLLRASEAEMAQRMQRDQLALYIESELPPGMTIKIGRAHV